MEFCWINTGRKVGNEFWKGSEGQRGFLTHGVYFSLMHCTVTSLGEKEHVRMEQKKMDLPSGEELRAAHPCETSACNQGFIPSLSRVSDSFGCGDTYFKVMNLPWLQLGATSAHGFPTEQARVKSATKQPKVHRRGGRGERMKR